MNCCTYRVIRLTAPAAVRGGKNSSEKNFSSFLIFLCILFISDSGEDGDRNTGDEQREDSSDEDAEDGNEILSTLAGNEGCDCAFGIAVRCAILIA